MAKIRRMFPGGNTSQGFYSLHDNIIGANRNMLYILKGMPGGGKSSLMREIGRRAIEEGYMVEYHHCPSDPNSIDGVVIRELNIGIIDGTPPHSMDPIYPGLTDKLIDLTRFIDTTKLQKYKEQIINAKLNNKEAYRKAFNYFKAAKCIYDEIEESNKKHVNIMERNNAIRVAMENIFDIESKAIKDTGFKTRKLFSTAYTPEGYIDYTEFILEDINNRYYLQGDIGTGKSKFLNKIVEEANIRNYYIEIYYNSLIPNKIESIFIPEIDIIVSSNITTKKFPHTIIDFNQFFDNSCNNQDDYQAYESLIDRGVKGLKGAKENHSILEKTYKKVVDYKGIDEEREKIWEEIKVYFKG